MALHFVASVINSAERVGTCLVHENICPQWSPRQPDRALASVAMALQASHAAALLSSPCSSESLSTPFC